MLEIARGLPGAQVKVDGKVIGTVAADGSFRHEVSRGEHAVELTKDEYNPTRFTASFTPGKSTRPRSDQLAMAHIVKSGTTRSRGLAACRR